MTTVVFYNGSMYADTQATTTVVGVSKTSNHKVGDILKTDIASKIFKIDDSPCNSSIILGAVGRVDARTDFINWTENCRSKELNYTLHSSFQAFEYDGETLTEWTVEPAGTKWVTFGWQFWRNCRYYCWKFVIKSEIRYTVQEQANGRTLHATMGSGGPAAMGYL